MMKILAIGNSFSEDASAYIHQMAEIAGYDVQIVNLYIGGCPLERHWQNVENNGYYDYHRNGVKSARRMTIAEALDTYDKEALDNIFANEDKDHSDYYLFESYVKKINKKEFVTFLTLFPKRENSFIAFKTCFFINDNHPQR